MRASGVSLPLTPEGFVENSTPGTLGGYRPRKICGRHDCPSVNRYLARGTDAPHRAFFAHQATAYACGYRPCGTCMPER